MLLICRFRVWTLCNTVEPRRRKPKGGKLEVELMRPALSFPFCFLSLCAWLKSPLGEPHSCCQATRLPGSRALMNSHSAMEVALPTHRTQGRTGGQTRMHVCKHACMCANTRQSVARVLPGQTGHTCTQGSHVWVFFGSSSHSNSIQW